MKLYVLLTLLVLASTSALSPERQKFIADKVNKLHTTWEATVYGKEVNPILGAIIGAESFLPVHKLTPTNLPENFDLREEYPLCESIREIRDQANCGSCWAFGAAEAMSDRVCIFSGQKDQRRISDQELLACCMDCGLGCPGGTSFMAWFYWYNQGIVTGGLYGDKDCCQPYFLPMCDHHVEGPHGPCGPDADTPKCKRKCQAGYETSYYEDKIYAKDAYNIDPDEESIMQEIYENGSVEADFMVFEDFLTYKSGVYQYTYGRLQGGHAIKLIGWGVTDDGVKYWLAVNSWNDSWGEKGLFRILRGEDECGIEDNVVAGTPDL